MSLYTLAAFSFNSKLCWTTKINLAKLEMMPLGKRFDFDVLASVLGSSGVISSYLWRLNMKTTQVGIRVV